MMDSSASSACVPMNTQSPTLLHPMAFHARGRKMEYNDDEYPGVWAGWDWERGGIGRLTRMSESFISQL